LTNGFAGGGIDHDLTNRNVILIEAIDLRDVNV